jgi:hypothetical protein
MDSPLFLQREAKLFVAFEADTDTSAVFEVPMLEGFSFSQSTNVNEVSLSEASSDGSTSRRGTARFTDSLAPAEFSFSTYVRPFISGGTNVAGNAQKGGNSMHCAVEECLWALFYGSKSYTKTSATANAVFGGASAQEAVVAATTASSTIVSTYSNVLKLQEADFYISLGTSSDNTASEKALYKLSKAVLNEATIDFDIDGIATINWTGFATAIEDVSTDPESRDFITASSALITATVNEGVTATNNFIQNRLSTVSLSNSTDPNSNFEAAYTLTLTGGSVTFSNNIEYVTPSTMGVVSQPLGHYTGSRSVTGSLSCYLDGTSGRSKDLFEDLAESSVLDVVNFFDLTVTLGGSSAPNLAVNVPAAHLEVPVHSVDDVVSMEINFHGLPHGGGSDARVQSISAANESTLTYIGVAPLTNNQSPVT